MVVHLRTTSEAAPPLVGFVVSRAVGPAVTRNLVKRRLRHLMRDRLGNLAEGSVLVVRAQAEAATRTSAELGAELDRVLTRLKAGGHR